MQLLEMINSDPEQGVIVEIKEISTQTIKQKTVVKFDKLTNMAFISEKG